MPQTFPNAARPNNVLAPLWSDLNPAAGGAIRVATLTDGRRFTVARRRLGGVKNFGNATTHSFELWIQLAERAASAPGPGARGSRTRTARTSRSRVTGPASATPASAIRTPGQNWGAENRNGTSGKNISPAPPNGSEWSVNTSPPTAGGSATITYDASSKQAGTYKSVASA